MEARNCRVGVGIHIDPEAMRAQALRQTFGVLMVVIEE
jgi:hypothetical protein